MCRQAIGRPRRQKLQRSCLGGLVQVGLHPGAKALPVAPQALKVHFQFGCGCLHDTRVHPSFQEVGDLRAQRLLEPTNASIQGDQILRLLGYALLGQSERLVCLSHETLWLKERVGNLGPDDLLDQVSMDAVAVAATSLCKIDLRSGTQAEVLPQPAFLPVDPSSGAAAWKRQTSRDREDVGR